MMKPQSFLDRVRDDARESGCNGRGSQKPPGHAPDQHGGDRCREQAVPKASGSRPKRERSHGRVLGQGSRKGGTEGHDPWRYLLHGDRTRSEGHQGCGDLRGCDPGSGVGLQGLLQTFAEDGIIPFPADCPESLVQPLLKLRGGQDGLRQGIPVGHTITLPKRQLEESGDNKPLDLISDLGVEHQLARSEVLRSRSAPIAFAPDAASFAASWGTARAMLAGAFSISHPMALRCIEREPENEKWRSTNASTISRRLWKYRRAPSATMRLASSRVSRVSVPDWLSGASVMAPITSLQSPRDSVVGMTLPAALFSFASVP